MILLSKEREKMQQKEVGVGIHKHPVAQSKLGWHGRGPATVPADASAAVHQTAREAFSCEMPMSNEKLGYSIHDLPGVESHACLPACREPALPWISALVWTGDWRGRPGRLGGGGCLDAAVVWACLPGKRSQPQAIEIERLGTLPGV